MGTPKMSTKQTHALDQRLRVLSNYRRRAVIRHLSENGDPTSIDDLAREVAGAAPPEISEGTDDRIATKLHHVDLPKLVDHGFVEYDPQEGTVRYRPDELVEQVLRSIESPE